MNRIHDVEAAHVALGDFQNGAGDTLHGGTEVLSAVRCYQDYSSAPLSGAQ